MILSRIFLLLSVLLMPLAALTAPGDFTSLDIKDLEYPPEAIVMKDRAGNDALVVFYHLYTGSEEMGFRVGRHTSEGVMDWGPKYVLHARALKSRGFTPIPVIMNDKLYLFGRHHKSSNHKREIIYNSFDTVEDLIAHTHSQKEKSFHYLGMQTKKDMKRFSVAVLKGPTVGTDTLMMALYERDGKSKTNLSLLRCTAKNDDTLSCPDYHMESTSGEVPALATLPLPESEEVVLLMKQGEYLGVQHYSAANKDWSAMNRATPVVLSNVNPMGVATLNDKLYIFANNMGEGLSASLSPSIWEGGAVWNTMQSIEGVHGRNGLKPVAYNGRLYIVYSNVSQDGTVTCRTIRVGDSYSRSCSTTYPPDMLRVMEVVGP